MHPYLQFCFGRLNVSISVYNLMMFLAFLAMLWYSWSRRVRLGLDEDSFWGLIASALCGGLGGAKLFYILLSWPELGEGLAQKALFVATHLEKGWGFFGGVAGAAAGGTWYLRRKGFPVLAAADLLVPGAALGNLIIRLGCFSAGCCYGLPADISWGVRFPHVFSRIPEALQGVPLHPVQLYEGGGNLLLFLALHFMARPRKLKDGSLFAGYLLGYGLLRFCVEFFRAQPDYYAGGVTAGQWLSLSFIAAGLAMLGLIYKKNGRPL